MEFYPGSMVENSAPRERSRSLNMPSAKYPINVEPRTGRRQSLVLTPKVLNKYSKVEEESASFQRKYDTAHYFVFGSHVKQKSVEYPSSSPAPWPVDSLVTTHCKSDPCLSGRGLYDRRTSCPGLPNHSKVSS